jgi:uncharacterized membrane protein
MSLYTIMKFLHVLLAIVAVGANVTYGVWISRASRDPRFLAFTLKGIKALDDRIANPAYLLALLTGLVMVPLGGHTWTTPWILTSLVLYAMVAVLALLGYSPILRRQIEVLEARGPEALEYRALAGRAQMIGAVLAVLVVVIVFLMVAKPVLWR